MATFHEVSQQVAKKFLHTVVVVDDKAFANEDDKPRQKKTDASEDDKEHQKKTNAPEALADMQSPGDLFGESATCEASHEAVAQQPRTDIVPIKPDPEQLDARTLIATFAKEGLICAVIEPQKGENDTITLGQASAAAKRADVVILDWDIHRDNGKCTRKIIADILRTDGENPNRLRLIVIYTGALEHPTILDDVKRELNLPQLEIVSEAHSLSAKNGAWRIHLLRKPDSRGENVLGAADKATVAQLPDIICQEFARMTEGLVRHVALQSLATLRDNTHTLLGHLSKDLDPAYVAHRMLIPKTPEDAEHHATELIIGELGALLHHFDVGSAAGPDALRAWLASQQPIAIESAKNGKDVVLNPQETEAWIVDGTQPPSLSKGKWEEIMDTKSVAHRWVTKALVGGNETLAQKANHEFAIATSLTRGYAKSPDSKAPRLTLGTILKRAEPDESGFEYLVCLQPRCDCVRIEKKGRTFMLLQCDTTKDTGKFFHFIVHNPTTREAIRLQMNAKIPDVKMIHFSSQKENESVIRAVENGDMHVFTDQQGQLYTWVGQLKEAQAQRLSNDFASQLSRVGLNEYEWLRRYALTK